MPTPCTTHKRDLLTHKRDLLTHKRRKCPPLAQHTAQNFQGSSTYYVQKRCQCDIFTTTFSPVGCVCKGHKGRAQGCKGRKGRADIDTHTQGYKAYQVKKNEKLRCLLLQRILFFCYKGVSKKDKKKSSPITACDCVCVCACVCVCVYVCACVCVCSVRTVQGSSCVAIYQVSFVHVLGLFCLCLWCAYSARQFVCRWTCYRQLQKHSHERPGSRCYQVSLAYILGLCCLYTRSLLPIYQVSLAYILGLFCLYTRSLLPIYQVSFVHILISYVFVLGLSCPYTRSLLPIYQVSFVCILGLIFTYTRSLLP